MIWLHVLVRQEGEVRWYDREPFRGYDELRMVRGPAKVWIVEERRQRWKYKVIPEHALRWDDYGTKLDRHLVRSFEDLDVAIVAAKLTE